MKAQKSSLLKVIQVNMNPGLFDAKANAHWTTLNSQPSGINFSNTYCKLLSQILCRNLDKLNQGRHNSCAYLAN